MGLPHHDLPPGPNVVTGWEKALEDVAGVTKIQAYSLQRFAGLLDQHASDDTYRTSPAYYALTGRRGLWTLTQDGTTVPFCWHPNISGEVLVFPPIGCNDLTPLLHGIATWPVPLSTIPAYNGGRYRREDQCDPHLPQMRYSNRGRKRSRLEIPCPYSVH
jgi:hypothetical protein